MNKTEFISAFAAKTSLTKAEAQKEVNAFIQTIEDAIGQGDKVAFPGFGTFEVAEKAAHKGFNPKTRLPIDIPAHKVVKFRPGSILSGTVK
jgi:DNA-binding protein HU-beta